MAATTPITHHLDRAVERYRLLTHPFYRAWQAGVLTRADLRAYALQYWHQVDAFPGYLAAVADRLPEGKSKTIVLDNYSDEVDQDHRGMWLRFAEEVGASERDVRSSVPEPETEGCVAAFSAGAHTASPAFALGMIYGYESQTPDVAATKVAGLRDHYGIEGAGVDYFELHADLDVEHSRDLGRAIEIAAQGDADVRAASNGAGAGAVAIWRLLDGVARIRGIELIASAPSRR
ncbi:MAG: iron-containing redox enzyme family protein [Actinomycetota bacterium]